MEDKALRGDQFALNLLNYMGSCWTVGPGSKTLLGGGGAGMLESLYGKVIFLRDTHRVYL